MRHDEDDGFRKTFYRNVPLPGNNIFCIHAKAQRGQHIMIIPSEAKILVDEINKTKYAFNKWEREFMENINDLIKNDRHLSDGRSNILHKIHEKSHRKLQKERVSNANTFR